MSETGEPRTRTGRYVRTVTDVAPTQRRMFEQSTSDNDGSFTAQDWVLFVSVAAIWGASFLLIDIGLDALPPGVITLIRVGSGAAALAVLPKPEVRIAHDDRARLVVLSVIWVGIPFTLFPIAEQYINSSVTGLLNGATPIFAATVAAVLLRQRAHGVLLGGIVVGFVGIVLISLPSISDGANEARGVFLVLGATVCYGFAINLAAPLQRRYGSLPLMARMLALATFWTTPYGLWELGDAEFEVGPIVAVVVVLGVVGTGIAFAIMGTLVGRVGSTRASFISASHSSSAERSSPDAPAPDTDQSPTSAGRISPIGPSSRWSAYRSIAVSSPFTMITVALLTFALGTQFAAGKTDSVEPTARRTSHSSLTRSARSITSGTSAWPKLIVSLLRIPPHSRHDGSPSPPRTRSSAWAIGRRSSHSQHLVNQTVPWTSITLSTSLPTFWWRPSMFWVIRAWSCPRRSSSTIASCPAFGSAVHAGVVSRFCHAARRTSGSFR